MKRFTFILSFLVVGVAFSAEIVTENQKLVCQEFRLNQEVRVYKDPSLFLPQLSQIYADPATGWDELMKESPIVTTVKGAVQLMKLGPAREFKNFGEIAKLYELVDPRFREVKKSPSDKSPMILPVKICSSDAYNDTMGFVLSADLEKSQSYAGEHAGLPPSAHPNPVPKLRKAPYWE